MARRERSHGGLPSLDSTAGPLRSQTADRQDSGPSFRAELRPRNVHTTLPATRGPSQRDLERAVQTTIDHLGSPILGFVKECVESDRSCSTRGSIRVHSEKDTGARNRNLPGPHRTGCER